MMQHAARVDLVAISARTQALAGCVERMVVELADLQALLGPVGSGAHPGDSTPLSTWLDVARAVGIDDSTIRAHRRRTRDPQRPFFASAADARAWYASVVAKPAAVPSPRRKRGPRIDGGVVDWNAVKL